MSSVTETKSSKAAQNGAAQKRAVLWTTTLETLVGAHPNTLRSLYDDAPAADPLELGDAPAGRLLNAPSLVGVFMLSRPLLKVISQSGFSWKGHTFDHGGNSGRNRVAGREMFRFHAEVGASRIDGRPALLLSYDNPSYNNPWPVRSMRCELRTIAPRVAIGPAFLDGAHQDRIRFWWGLEGTS